MARMQHAIILIFVFLGAYVGAAEYVYIVNGSGSVAVLDTTTFTPIPGSPFTTISPPPLPADQQVNIKMSPNGRRVYVPGFQAANTVAVFDVNNSTGALTPIAGSPFSGFNAPFGVTVSPDSSIVYITNFGNDTIAVLTADMVPLGAPISINPPTNQNPATIVLSPDGSHAYVACTGSSTIMRFDTSTSPPYLTPSLPISSTSSGGTNPYAVAINPAGTVYCTNLTGQITRFSPDLSISHTEVSGVTGVMNPIAIAFDPDGMRIYVGSAGLTPIGVLDAITLMPAVIGGISSQGTQPYVVAVNPAGTRLFASNAGSNTLSVRDLVHDTYPAVTGSPFSGFVTPYGIAFTSVSFSAPRNLTGKQRKNDFGIEYERMNVLKWEASTGTGVSGYNIYRDGVKIAAVSSSTFSYQDHNRKKGVSTNYSVTAFNSSGAESSPATISVQ